MSSQGQVICPSLKYSYHSISGNPMVPFSVDRNIPGRSKFGNLTKKISQFLKVSTTASKIVTLLESTLSGSSLSYYLRKHSKN